MIRSVLEETQLSDRRAVTIHVEEYFTLLLAFNKRGIHFRNISVKGSSQLPDTQEISYPFQGRR